MAGKIKIEEIAVRTAGVAAGAVVARVSDRFTGSMNPLIVGGGKIVGGAILPALMPKNKFVENMASGIIAQGAVQLFDKFTGGAVSGVDPSQEFIASSMIDEDYIVSGSDDELNPNQNNVI